jgi:hypothetical protein
MGLDAQDRVLKRMGLDYHVPDSGCCGMAGRSGTSGGTTTTCRSSAASGCCFRRCDRPAATS